MTRGGDRLGVLMLDATAVAVCGWVLLAPGTLAEMCGQGASLFGVGALLLGLFVAWQVQRGEARLRGMAPIALAEEPLWFWLAVLPSAAFGGTLAVIALHGAAPA